MCCSGVCDGQQSLCILDAWHGNSRGVGCLYPSCQQPGTCVQCSDLAHTTHLSCFIARLSCAAEHVVHTTLWCFASLYTTCLCTTPHRCALWRNKYAAGVQLGVRHKQSCEFLAHCELETKPNLITITISVLTVFSQLDCICCARAPNETHVECQRVLHLSLPAQP